MSMIRATINGMRESGCFILKKKMVNRAGRWVIRAMLVLMVARTAAASVADTPVTPNASPEAQALRSYFSDIYGKKIISGQQEGWRRTNGLCFELNYLTNTTGKLPALLAMDLLPYTDTSPRHDTNHLLAKQALDWYQNRHGIVEFCWHWRAPMNGNEIYTKDTRFDLSRGVTEGTPEN